MPLPALAAQVIRVAVIQLFKSSWFRKYLVVKGTTAAAQVGKSVYNKISKMDDGVRENLIRTFEMEAIPGIKQMIMQDYNSELVAVVTNRNSKTNPIFYRDEFMTALDEYEYLELGENSETLSVPNIESFNWGQGRLRVIENILEGTAGRYVEIDEEQYITMYGKRPTTQPFDKVVPRKERIYLLRLNADVNNRWARFYPNDAMVNYPFSNRSSIDIFTNANRYVKENMSGWVKDAIKKSQKEHAK